MFEVYAKNLSTTKTFKCSSTSLHTLNGETFQYSVFNPCNVDDFQKTEEYGIIEGNRMVKCYILAMAETQEELNKKIDSKKVNVPRRKSTGPTSHPLSSYSRALEKAQVKKNRSQATEFKAKNTSSNNSSVVARFVAAQKNKPLKATDSSRTVKSSTPVESAQPTCHDVCHKSTQTVSTACTSCSKYEAQEKLQNSELEMLRIQLDVERSECLEVKKKLKEYESSTKQTLEKIAKIPDMLLRQGATNSGSISIASKIGKSVLTSRGEEEKDLEIPDDMVHVGAGVLVLKTDLEEVEDEPTLGKRVAALCALYWPGAVHLMSPSGKVKTQFLTVKRIPECHIASMKKILNAMYWPEPNFSVKDPMLRRHLRHHTSEVRTAFLDREHPEREREKRPRKQNKKGTREERIETVESGTEDEEAPSKKKRSDDDEKEDESCTEFEEGD